MKYVAERLLQAIAGGEYEPGEPLPGPSELAARFRSDAKRIEGALALLGTRGHVVRHPELGWVVPAGSAPSLRDLQTFRDYLTGLLAELRLNESDLIG